VARGYRRGMTYNTNPAQAAPVAPRRPLGLPIIALVGLAALGLPRVILHDLHIIDEGDPLNWLLAIGPVAVWIVVALVKKVPNPFLTVLLIGAFFGAMLVISHQLLWDVAFAGNLPSLGDGNIATILPRVAAVPSGLITGTLIGAIGGLIAWGIQSAMKRRSASRKAGDALTRCRRGVVRTAPR
jgi:hypothetical protein